jgi:hypothetical protein
MCYWGVIFVLVFLFERLSMAWSLHVYHRYMVALLSSNEATIYYLYYIIRNTYEVI